MKNVLGGALTLSNAGNWRETQRNAVGMIQQMNVEGKKNPGFMSHYLLYLCHQDKGSCCANTKLSTQHILWNMEVNLLLIAYLCIVNLSSGEKLHSS